jgi:hypothetical protein
MNKTEKSKDQPKPKSKKTDDPNSGRFVSKPGDVKVKGGKIRVK